MLSISGLQKRPGDWATVFCLSFVWATVEASKSTLSFFLCTVDIKGSF